MSYDASADTAGVVQLLGQAQRQAARRREEQLEDAVVSLFRSLDGAELAYEYDRWGLGVPYLRRCGQ